MIVKRLIMKKKKLLFICTANLQRSPTAEEMFRKSRKYQAKSAGISPFSLQPVTGELIKWADVIFVFSEKQEGQKSFLLEKFRQLRPEKVIDLDIEDKYYRDDPKLVAVLKRKLPAHLK